MSTSGENSYSSIIKRLSAFGGVQVFNALISIVRGKFVAIFLGPEGMGIASLFTVATTPIQQIAGLGLGNAIVKETSASKTDSSRNGDIIRVILRLVWLTSLFGGIMCALGAPLWSRFTFGDSSQTLSFVWLGLFVALTMAGTGYLNILQGMGEVKRLARASVVGGLSGLVFGVPLYWLYGDRGIVPAMILLSACTFAFYFISYRKSVGKTLPAPVPDTKSRRPIARKLVLLGLTLLSGSLAGTLTNYLITVFVRQTGGEVEVGLFQSASSITSQYIGLVFSALALDYFPRLSAVCHDKEKLSEVTCRQIEVVMLTVTPLIMLLMTTAPLVIRLLLTEEFMPTLTLVRWLGYGSFLMAVSYPLGYIFVARDDRKIYFWTECVVGNIMWLLCSIGGYILFGLDGLGISLVARNLVDIIMYYAICRLRYGLTSRPEALREAGIASLLCSACFVLSFWNGVPGYILMGVLCIVAVARSFAGLRRRFRSQD